MSFCPLGGFRQHSATRLIGCQCFQPILIALKAPLLVRWEGVPEALATNADAPLPGREKVSAHPLCHALDAHPKVAQNVG